MDSKSPNIEMLRQLYRQSPVARTFFDHAARRERDQSETKVDRILIRLRADGHAFPRRDIIDLFRKLQEQGCGQFVEGRRGCESSADEAVCGNLFLKGCIAGAHEWPGAIFHSFAVGDKLDKIINR